MSISDDYIVSVIEGLDADDESYPSLLTSIAAGKKEAACSDGLQRRDAFGASLCSSSAFSVRQSFLQTHSK